MACDANGNIAALINASDKTTAARYEYSPYGELLRATGPLARSNPFRWSTKFWDGESGLVYYGYRFFNPSLGRWINRDPTTDQIFLNLYLFCHNNSVNGFDVDGRTDLIQTTAAGGINAYLASKVGGACLGFFYSFVTSMMNDLARGKDVDWLQALGYGVSGAFLGGNTGGIMPGPGLAGVYSALDAMLINSYVGSMAGFFTGVDVGVMQNARDLIGDEKYRQLKNQLQNEVGSLLTAGDVTFAVWLFDE